MYGTIISLIIMTDSSAFKKRFGLALTEKEDGKSILGIILIVFPS